MVAPITNSVFFMNWLRDLISSPVPAKQPPWDDTPDTTFLRRPRLLQIQSRDSADTLPETYWFRAGGEESRSWDARSPRRFRRGTAESLRPDRMYSLWTGS